MLDLGDLDTKYKIKINTWLSYIAYSEDKFEISGAYIEENIRLSRMLGDLPELATALLNLGVTYLVIGKPREGSLLVHESVSIQRKLGDKNLIGHGLQTLVGYYIRLGSLAEAQTYADEHLALAAEIGSDVEIVWAHSSLAAISCEQGDYQRAYAYLMEDQDFIAKSDSLGSMVSHQHTLASVLLPLGRYTQARELCLRLLAYGLQLFELHYFLGQIAAAEGNPDHAIAIWQEALTLSGDWYAQQVKLHSALAEMYLYNGDFAQAQAQINEVLHIERSQSDSLGMFIAVEAHPVQAKLYVHLGELSAAKDVLCEVLNRVRDLEVIVPRLNALVATSAYLAAIGDVRGVQVLSLVVRHSGTSHAQRIAYTEQRIVLAQQFGDEACDHAWEMAKTAVMDEVLAALLAEWACPRSDLSLAQ